MTDAALQPATALIAQYEDFVSHPYQDSAGVWTIGFGFTYLEDGSRVLPTTPPITREDGEAMLSAIVARTLDNVRAMAHVALSVNQAAALTSLAYNIGTAALRKSHLMLALNGGQTAEAADQFRVWCHAGGVFSRGLAARREAERALFLDRDLPDGSTTAPYSAEEPAYPIVLPDDSTATDALNDAELKRIT